LKMLDKPNKLGRQTLAIVHIDLPLDVSPFHTNEELEEALREAVARLTFPEEARVNAFVGFLPNPMEEMQVVKIQQGFYKEPE